MGPASQRHLQAGDLHLADRFQSGTPALDEWLRVYAWTNHNSGSARVYVSLDTSAGLIAGFYSLSAGAVEHAETPRRVSKGLALHPILIVLIGRLAVDRRYANQGVGRFLVRDAFQHVIETSEIIGTRAVMVQAKSPEAASSIDDWAFNPPAPSRCSFFTWSKMRGNRSWERADAPENAPVADQICAGAPSGSAWLSSCRNKPRPFNRRSPGRHGMGEKPRAARYNCDECYCKACDL